MLNRLLKDPFAMVTKNFHQVDWHTGNASKWCIFHIEFIQHIDFITALIIFLTAYTVKPSNPTPV